MPVRCLVQAFKQFQILLHKFRICNADINNGRLKNYATEIGSGSLIYIPIYQVSLRLVERLKS